MVVVEVINPLTKEVHNYMMEPRLKSNLDKKVIPYLDKKDKDFVMVIDGKEGGGKSTLALQIGKYVDPSLDLSRVVFNAEEFRHAIYKAKKGQVVIFDEAFTGLSSRSALSAINKMLVSLMMQMRQKNLMVIIVLPTFFLLDKYVALFRARVLVHVYEMSGVRGYFRLYNSKLKKTLYLMGKKDYSYGHKIAVTRFKGRFFGKFALGDDKVEAEYRKKKGEALENTENAPTSAIQEKYRAQRDVLLWRLKEETKKSYRQLATYLEQWDFDMKHVQVRGVCIKFGEKVDDKTMKKVKKLREHQSNPEDTEDPLDSED